MALAAGVVAAAALADLAAAPRRPRSYRTTARLALLARIGRRLSARRGAPADLVSRLAAAGDPLDLSPADLMAVKAGGALLALLVAVPTAAAAPGRLGVAIGLGAPVAGFLGPDLWLRRRAQRRSRAIARELPDVLDLLRVAVEAGLPVGRALGDVGQRHRGVLGTELRAAAARSDLGVPRDEVLRRLRARAPLPAVAMLVAAVERSERHGAPLGPALSALATDARAEQGRALAEHAAKAAPKIQLVVALLLVPSVLLLVGAAVVQALLT
jgi:tight adherence protein C